MLKRIPVLFAIAALISVFSSGQARCSDEGLAVVDAAVDLAVPDSPGLAALGLGPNMVDRPGSPRELAVSLLHGVDTNGNVQTALSADVAPFLWYGGQRVSLREYRERYFLRFLSRTLLSFAAAHGDSVEEAGTRFAFGLRFTPWDEGDPRMDEELSDCLRDAVAGVKIGIREGTEALQKELDALRKQRSIIERRIEDEAAQAGEELQAVLRGMLGDMDRKTRDLEERLGERVTMNVADLNDRTAAAMTACRNGRSRQERLWKRSGWSLGVVPTFIGSAGAGGDLTSSGTALWTSVAYDLRDLGQLIVHARTQNNEAVLERSGSGRLIEQDSVRVGGRLRFGEPDLNFSIEGLHVTEKRAQDQYTDKKIQYGAGLEHRIAADVWFAFTIGREEYDNEDDNVVVLASLRWAHTPPPARKF